MGKYMRKPKITGDVAVMDSSQSSLGVRTRAKTLALQRLQSSSPQSSYLELRTRRLQKPPLLNKQQKQDNTCPCPNPSSRLRRTSANSASVGSLSIRCCSLKQEGYFAHSNQDETGYNYDLGFDASFGENNFDFEPRDRSTRESTPCSLIRGPDNAGTPGSSTRSTSLSTVNRRLCNSQRNIPTTHELEEFFACAEQQQQRHFIQKYNFDVVNDMPLPGRYEWVSV